MGFGYLIAKEEWLNKFWFLLRGCFVLLKPTLVLLVSYLLLTYLEFFWKQGAGCAPTKMFLWCVFMFTSCDWLICFLWNVCCIGVFYLEKITWWLPRGFKKNWRTCRRTLLPLAVLVCNLSNLSLLIFLTCRNLIYVVLLVYREILNFHNLFGPCIRYFEGFMLAAGTHDL